MNTDNLMHGLQIFIIGFGGVLLAMTVISLSIALMGRVFSRIEEKKPPAP